MPIPPTVRGAHSGPLDEIVCLKHTRKVTRDNTVKYQWRMLQLLPDAERSSYAGVPCQSQDAFWHKFWNNKLRALRRQGVHTYRGRLSSNGQNVQKKVVDVSMATDLVQAAHHQSFDLAIIVSQDSDLAPAVALARQVAQAQNRSVNFESAIPQVPGRRLFGIRGTILAPIDKATYDKCLDPTDYR